MAVNYAVRITKPYSQLDRGVAAVAMLCDKTLVYEHVGTKTEKVHVHMMLIGVRCDKKTLQAKFPICKGNKDWSWKTKDAKYGDVEDSPKYITYMTKGKLDPVYNKGYTIEELNEAKAAWTDKKKSKAMIEYEAFDLMIDKSLPQDPVVEAPSVQNPHPQVEYRGFNVVRKKAFEYVMEKHGLASPAAKCLMSTLYRTYCYKHGIVMDPKFDTW